MIDSKGVVRISPVTVKSVQSEEFGTEAYASGTDHDRISAEYWRICERSPEPPHLYKKPITHEGDYFMGTVLESKKQNLIMGVSSEIVKGMEDPVTRGEALYYLSSSLGSMYEVAVYVVGRCIKMERVIALVDEDELLVSRKLKHHETAIVDPIKNIGAASAEFEVYRDANRHLFSTLSRLAINHTRTLDHYRESHFSRHLNPALEEYMDRDLNFQHVDFAYKQAAYIMLKTCQITTVAAKNY